MYQHVRPITVAIFLCVVPDLGSLPGYWHHMTIFSQYSLILGYFLGLHIGFIKYIFDVVLGYFLGLLI
jgi:hypothetical protein